MFANMQGNAKKCLTSKLVLIQEKQHNSLFQNVPYFTCVPLRPWMPVIFLCKRSVVQLEGYSLQGSVRIQLSSVCNGFNASRNPEAVFPLEKWVSGFMQKMFVSSIFYGLKS